MNQNTAHPSEPDQPLPLQVPPPAEPLADFQRTLVGLTPHVYVTPVLIGLNVLVFVLMAVSGASPANPSIQDLLRWGANFGMKTTEGEWWRLLTCVFVHIGFVHLLSNMWALVTAGPLVERMLGNIGFLVLYVVAGLCGSLASLFWNPLLVSAGASGAIFGVYGGLLALLLLHGGSIPTKILTQLRNSGLGFVAFNLYLGLQVPNIDHAAHVGGLVGGFLGGLVLGQPITPEALARRPRRNVLTAGLGLVLVVAGFVVISAWHGDVVANLANVQSELNRFESVERKALDTVNGAVAKSERQELTNAAFVDLLERDVLPPWKAQRERLAALKQLPAPLQSRIASFVQYMTLREEGWTLLVEAIREGSDDKVKQAMTKQKLADEAVKRLQGGNGK
jgi:rhomboid protease GluP